jgi:uncharacterized membrane protein
MMRRWTEERMERFIGGLLRAGVLLAAGIVFVGAVWYFARHGGEPPNYGVFHGEPQSVHEVVVAAFAGEGLGLIRLGLLVLIATPVARVLFSVFAFGARGDGRYVIITLIVLAALGLSLFGTLVR